MNDTTNDIRNAAVKSINAAMETETGRKILTAKIISLMQENKTLKRSVADDRIAVHALNHLSTLLVRIVDSNYQVFKDNALPLDPESQKRITALQQYQLENFGVEMSTRIANILNDPTGDDLLLEDLIGKQPKEEV
jgi:hypothetical protein